MKYSKQLPDEMKNRCWGVFMAMTVKMRIFVYNNNFEAYCKTFKKET